MKHVLIFIALAALLVAGGSTLAVSAGPGLPFISSSQATYRVLGQDGDQKLHTNIGKPTLVVFWAAWCIPCLHEIPHLNHLHATWETDGLRILAMSIDEGSDATIAHTAKKFEMIYPVARPSAQLVRDFGVEAIPATFLYAPDGSLAQKWLGPVSAKEIETYLNKWITRPAAAKSGP
ncbi:MAG: TlpA disulfide reductase family protein [Candidatus Lernaella stagnicola]|nr:TlpA disulfide reductase family protein [Candidatus Lernaella stagnicola]